jgi:hypothetical protein
VGDEHAGVVDVRPTLADEGRLVLAKLTPEEREALIIQCWMSHDARWFMAAALTAGMDAAQKINRLAVREEGKVEARRLSKRLGLPPPETVRDYLVLQEAIIGLLGPDLLGYEIAEVGEDGFDLRIERCFAFDNVSRAGMAGQYLCGILPRVQGWLDASGLRYELRPEPARCLMAQGRECVYEFSGMRPPPPV